ncbi:hypothetical protein [Hyphococcus luteus]|uniref:Uncharacterized protein n=1 Tax=Hyphococcus luteus TaxID=2058213 RepID=A0A2S7K4X5_9PROT|nr:hypothetical protein [Marinicaulis flavus]PQA87526.1 hypothetical protein CW354_12045 [Marinicaulis flavus]
MSESQVSTGNQEITWFWEEVEADVRETLTPQQRVAIENAVKNSSSHAQPADVRLYLGKYFVRIIAGKERRNKKRLKQDLKDNPVFARKNTPVIVFYWIVMFLATLYILGATSKVIMHYYFM